MPVRGTASGPARSAPPKGTVPARLLMLPIKGYRRFISPLLGPRCRFEPSCSAYALAALAEYGAARGLWLAVARIARCHPFHPGGYDPVPARKRSEEHTSELQSHLNLVCRLLLEKKNITPPYRHAHTGTPE